MLNEDFIYDEFGRFWLITEDGAPYSGPYATMEDVAAALDRDEESEQD